MPLSIKGAQMSHKENDNIVDDVKDRETMTNKIKEAIDILSDHYESRG